MLKPRQWEIWVLIALVAIAGAFALTLSGCATGGVGVVGSLYAAPVAGAKPTLLARYDGNTFVAWGEGAAIAELYIQATGLPLYPPVSVAAGKAIVKVRKPEFKWEGTVGDPLPVEAEPMFRTAEVEAWQLAFGTPTPVPPPPVPEVTP